MTSGRVDELRQRCEKLLAPGEEILLEADAECKLGYVSDVGAGRAYLTDRRIVWFLSSLLPHQLLFRVPDIVVAELSAMEQVEMIRQGSRAWLRFTQASKTYHIRIGRGSFPVLRDNPRTTQEWFRAIRALKSGDFSAVAEVAAPERRRELRLAGVLFIALVILSVPLWLAGAVLTESPVEYYLIMGALTVAGIGVGFLLRRMS